MDLTKEAIEKIVSLSPNNKAVIVAEPGDRVGAYLVMKPDGTYDIREAPPARRRPVLKTPDDLLNYIRNVHPADLAVSASEVYVNEGGAIYIEDSADRRDVAQMPLNCTQPMLWLIDAEPSILYSQTDLLELFRIKMRGVISTDLVKQLRKVRFERSNVTDNSREAQRESLSRAVINEVKTEIDLPDEVVINCNYWEETMSPVSVVCFLAAVPDREMFRFCPFPGEVERAEKAAVDRLFKEFEGLAGNVPVYRGIP